MTSVFRAPAIALALLLAACTSAPGGPIGLPLQERLRNPLVAERYWSDLAEHMADFTRTGDPITKDPVRMATVEAERLRALERVEQSRALINEGRRSHFQSVSVNEDAMGFVLVREGIVSLDPSFLVRPGPSVHLYLTTALDPRDAPFPDPTSLDLGQLQTAYGAQEYAIPEGQQNPAFRTVVLYDPRLQRLIGFAQL